MGCLNLSGDIVEADARARGTWWWYVNPKDHAEYLKFAEENRINEIYFHTNFNDRDFSNSRIGSFIESAGKRGIKVFLLTSEYEHIWDRELFKKLMDDYRVFQNSMPKRKRFAGLHI